MWRLYVWLWPRENGEANNRIKKSLLLLHTQCWQKQQHTIHHRLESLEKRTVNRAIHFCVLSISFLFHSFKNMFSLSLLLLVLMLLDLKTMFSYASGKLATENDNTWIGCFFFLLFRVFFLVKCAPADCGITIEDQPSRNVKGILQHADLKWRECMSQSNRAEDCLNQAAGEPYTSALPLELVYT